MKQFRHLIIALTLTLGLELAVPPNALAAPYGSSEYSGGTYSNGRASDTGKLPVTGAAAGGAILVSAGGLIAIWVWRRRENNK
jgi:hypothetical protein